MSVPPPRPAPGAALTAALEAAADRAVLAPSVHNTQPWRLVLHGDRLELHADRSRQLTVLDPRGRALAQSVGAALLNARAAVAAAGFAAAVDRLPDRDDPDLLAVLRPGPGPADASLARLDAAVPLRHTNRRRFGEERVPDELLRVLVEAADAEDTLLVPVDRPDHLDLLGRLQRTADGIQNADPAYRAELRRWTTRSADQGDGVPPEAVAHVDGRQHDALPLRDFDTTGSGGLPARTGSGTAQTVVLLAGRTDDLLAWLRAGEALERVLLELTTRGWVAAPMTQAVEVPLTRTQLRSALVWHGHPLNLLRVGRAAPTPTTPRRRRDDAVRGSGRPPAPLRHPPVPGATGWVPPVR
ncbi:nitroreductase [Blastococcus sp. TF02A-30]|uniref:Acg family FMN-binding oxidoreductase n=1 Tax=Blastococcus sp. TF02A-30 TaxID=2250580 RepID=UPI000DE88F8C|nr:nitroreductase [Blastococcus sp. TF02A-30]RBY87736.1 nitroreductase [Blastococcus sp. TF02A-30]